MHSLMQGAGFIPAGMHAEDLIIIWGGILYSLVQTARIMPAGSGTCLALPRARTFSAAHGLIALESIHPLLCLLCSLNVRLIKYSSLCLLFLVNVRLTSSSLCLLFSVNVRVTSVLSLFA